MPLCGVKKSKKQKRDPSPPYNRSAIEDTKAENAELKGRLDESEQELKRERQLKREIQQEVADLKRQLENAQTELVKTEHVVPVTSNKDDDELAEKVRELQAKVAQATQELDKEKDEKHKIKTEGDSLRSKVQELQQTSTSSSGNKEEVHQEYTVQLSNINVQLDEEKKQRSATEDELRDIKKSLEAEKDIRQKAEEEKEKFKREKDNLETTLNFTKKELDIAKKESHIPRSPTRAPSEEWKAKIDVAEAEFEKEREHRMEKERDLSRLNSEKEELEQSLANMQQQAEEEKSDLKKNLANTELTHKNELMKLEDDYRRKLDEGNVARQELLQRLSSLTAAQVLDGNPNVSDLSDPNRPQKLGEFMLQLYDDQWTYASDALEKLDKDEEEIPQILLNLLMVAYNHCKEAAETQLTRIEEDIFLPPLDNPSPSGPETNGSGTEALRSPTSSKGHSLSKIPRFSSHKSRPALPNLTPEKKTIDSESVSKEKQRQKRSETYQKVKGEKLPEIPTEVRKGIKEYRKKVTKQVTPVIQKEVMNKLRNNPEVGDRIVDACRDYISRCVELCWLMRVQDPPVVLSWNVSDDNTFDSDVYRAYTKSGTHVDFVVWPVMYLYDGGPTLSKGIAQGKNS